MDGDLDAARRDIAAAVDGYRAAADEWGLADALTVQGSIARAAGEIDVAAESYREGLSLFNILSDEPATIRLYRALGETYFAAGDYTAVTMLYLEALTPFPGDPVLLTGLGYAKWYEGRFADALAYLSEVLSADADNQPALSARSQVEADVGQPEDALTDLDRALASDVPNAAEQEADLRSARALALARLGKLADSETELSTAFRLLPQRALTFLRAAQIRLHSGDQPEARSLLKDALATAPPLLPGYAAKARALLDSLSG